MERRTLATLIGATLFVALLSMLIYTAQERRAAVQTTRPTTTRQAAAPAASVGPASSISTRPPQNETPQQRRARMISNKDYRDDFKLSEQDIYLYVQAKGSNAVSLVTGFESTRDKEYLKAALEKFPNDPFVQAKALLWLDMSDAERAKLAEAFKASSPDNAFANFLAAREAVKRGDTQAALAEVAASKGKGYNEFDKESAQGLEDAYLFAGRSEAEAKTLGMSEVTLPQLAEFKKLGHEFIDLAEKSAAAGDAKTQQEMLMANWQIGNTMRNGGHGVALITELVGIAIENLSLRAWPTGTPFGDGTPADVLAANATDSKSLRSGTPLFDKWFPTAPDEEVVTYMDMTKASGERDAIAWLQAQHPEFAQALPTK